jgi:hypothetical protein
VAIWEDGLTVEMKWTITGYK